ncbi:hypothetical protein ACWNX2_00075 [Candidatus Vidania fulgoroideorum]
MLFTLKKIIQILKVLLINSYYNITILHTTKQLIKNTSKIYKLPQCNGNILTFYYDTPKVIINSNYIEILLNKQLKNSKYVLYTLCNTLVTTLHKSQNSLFKIAYLLVRKPLNK